MGNGIGSKSFALESKTGSKKTSFVDDRVSEYTNNNKGGSKSTKHSHFDSKKFQQQRYIKLKNGLEAVLHTSDVSKYDDTLRNHTSAMDFKYLSCPGKNMENLKFELGLRSYQDNKKNKKDKEEKKDNESLMSKSQK